jgi:hypothetical protein
MQEYIGNFFEVLKDVLIWMWSIWPTVALEALYDKLPEETIVLIQPMVDGLIIANHYFPCKEAFELAVLCLELKLGIIVIKWVLKFIPTMGG